MTDNLPARPVGLSADEATALQNMPEQLILWFAGHGVVAEEFGMPRFEIRYRVVSVLSAYSYGEGYMRVNPESIREFKTHKAAKAYQERLAKQGRTAIIQYAPLVWLTQEESRRITDIADRREKERQEAAYADGIRRRDERLRKMNEAKGQTAKGGG